MPDFDGHSEAAKEAIEKLCKAMDVTYGARFEAERRLRRHDQIAQHTLTFQAVVLIAVPVFGLAGFPSRFSSNAVNAIQVILAVFVLALSLLLGQRSFLLRAVALNRSARAMLHLHKQLEIVRRRAVITEQEYLKCARKYAKLIELSEPHRRIDYLVIRLHRRKVFYKDKTFLFYRDHAWLILWRTWTFIPYLIALFLPLCLLLSFRVR